MKCGLGIGHGIGWNYQSIWVSASVLDWNQNSGFGHTLSVLLLCLLRIFIKQTLLTYVLLKMLCKNDDIGGLNRLIFPLIYKLKDIISYRKLKKSRIYNEIKQFNNLSDKQVVERLWWKAKTFHWGFTNSCCTRGVVLKLLINWDEIQTSVS